MKRLIILLIIIFTTNILFAQTANHQAASSNFQKYYNAGQYDEIFNSFTPEMKAALPLEKTRQFLSSLREQIGSIESMLFISDQQSGYALYKTKFQKAVVGVNISLDPKNQITGLLIKPYEDQAQQLNKTSNSLSSYPKEIAELIFTATKDLPDNAQLAIAIINNGKTDYYGVKKMNDFIVPAENQQKFFEIGSITKVFTSAVLASLVLDKKLKSTDEINSYYPFTFKGDIRFTFLSLANHTSGLPRLPENLNLSNKENPYKSYGKAELEAYLKQMINLKNEPATTYSYSNLGAGLLGYTLGLSQKTTFQKLLQTKIFDKYEMKNAVTSSENLANKLVKGLNKQGEQVSNWDIDVLFAAGGIVSTTEDLVKFINAQFNPKNKELELTRKTTFEIKGDTKIGLGWHILSSANNEDLFWHNGGTGGYSSSVVMKIAKKKAVIILSNVFDINDKIDALSYNLLDKK